MNFQIKKQKKIFDLIGTMSTMTDEKMEELRNIYNELGGYKITHDLDENDKFAMGFGSWEDLGLETNKYGTSGAQHHVNPITKTIHLKQTSKNDARGTYLAVMEELTHALQAKKDGRAKYISKYLMMDALPQAFGVNTYKDKPYWGLFGPGYEYAHGKHHDHGHDNDEEFNTPRHLKERIDSKRQGGDLPKAQWWNPKNAYTNIKKVPSLFDDAFRSVTKTFKPKVIPKGSLKPNYSGASLDDLEHIVSSKTSKPIYGSHLNKYDEASLLFDAEKNAWNHPEKLQEFITEGTRLDDLITSGGNIDLLATKFDIMPSLSNRSRVIANIKDQQGNVISKLPYYTSTGSGGKSEFLDIGNWFGYPGHMQMYPGKSNKWFIKGDKEASNKRVWKFS